MSEKRKSFQAEYVPTFFYKQVSLGIGGTALYKLSFVGLGEKCLIIIFFLSNSEKVNNIVMHMTQCTIASGLWTTVGIFLFSEVLKSERTICNF